jgi:RimJ/RimL family protein N-acetyltransferase
MASFVWMLLTEPTYNRTRFRALAWWARNLSQKALRNVSPFSTARAFPSKPSLAANVQSRPMTPILETQHLKLREFRQDDLDDLAAMVADEEQMRFYPRPKTRDEACAWISRNLVLYEEHGFGFWFIESIRTSGFLGYCGIRPLSLHGASEREIGWHIKKTFWNQGVATEAATAARDLAFRRFAIARLVAIIHPDHIASRRVAEKIGMHDEKTTIHDDYSAVIYMTERP